MEILMLLGEYMETKLRVGFVQFEVTSDIDRNVSHVKNEIEKLARNDMELIVLPELWSSGFDYKMLDEAVKRTPDILRTISGLAKEHNITVVGSLPKKRGKKIFNTAFVTDPSGKVVCRYKKIHLFPPLGEDKHFSPGKDTETFFVRDIKVGVVICFDIRYPELIRKLRAEGISILVVCAQWPKIRYLHWISLLRARAIENQIFIIAVNSCGIHAGQEYLGHSVILNPYGESVYEALDFEDTTDALIDLKLIERFRNQFDSFALRRPKAYED
jgi:predicted amidohydrolase